MAKKLDDLLEAIHVSNRERRLADEKKARAQTLKNIKTTVYYWSQNENFTDRVISQTNLRLSRALTHTFLSACRLHGCDPEITEALDVMNILELGLPGQYIAYPSPLIQK